MQVELLNGIGAMMKQTFHKRREIMIAKKLGKNLGNAAYYCLSIKYYISLDGQFALNMMINRKL